jgi:hypothetical protein
MELELELEQELGRSQVLETAGGSSRLPLLPVNSNAEPPPLCILFRRNNPLGISAAAARRYY